MTHITLARCLATALLTGLSFVSGAQTIDELVRHIVANNPDLQSRDINITADKYEADDANALANPEVELGRVWGKDGVGNKLQFDISQSFDWPGAYRSRKRANAMGVSAARQQLVADRLVLAQEAKQMLVELVYLRKQRQILTDLLQNMQQVNAGIAKSLEKRNVTILDERKARLETYKYESELASVSVRERELVASLQALAGGCEMQLDDVREYPLEQLMSLQDYHAAARSADPALAAANLRAQQSELDAKAAVMSRYPSFSVGYEHQTELGDHFNGFTVGMTLPFFENRHGAKAMKLRRQAEEKAMEQTLADNVADIDAKYSAMAILKEQMDAYRQAFGDNAYLTLLKKSYDGGEITVIDYINETNYYHSNLLSYLQAEYSYYASICDLNKYNMLEYINK